MAKILKGLSGLRIFPITANDVTTYTTGAAVQVPGLQSLGLDPDVTEWKVMADDGVYEAGADWNGMKISLQLAELPISLKPHFEGGDYDETSKEYTYHSDDSAPEIGFTFRAKTSDGNYRMIKLFVLKCSKVKEDYKTKGESGGDSTPVVIEGTVTQRKIDNAAKREKDTMTDADLTWLETLVDPEP